VHRYLNSEHGILIVTFGKTQGGRLMAEEQQYSIKLHDQLQAKDSNKPKLRYGRGESGKGGKTATRGTKGTRARNTVPAGFEGGQLPLHMRLPKLRGLRNHAKVEFQVVN